jgi:CarD family transcriptional regulator
MEGSHLAVPEEGKNLKKNRSVTKSSAKATLHARAGKVDPRQKGGTAKRKTVVAKDSGKEKAAKKIHKTKGNVSTSSKSQKVAPKVSKKLTRAADTKGTKVVQIPKASLADRLKIAVTSAKNASSSNAGRKVVAVEEPVVAPVRTRRRASHKVSATIPVTKISRAEDRVGDVVAPVTFVGREVATLESSSAVRATAVIVKESEISVQVDLFVAGDKIVYPQHGVGEVECVSKTMVGGQEHHVYDIKILETGMKIRVPVAQAAANGLRRIIDKRTIEKVYDILKDRDFKIDTQTWNRRAREYQQKIKTGSVYEIAMVLRDLSVLGADKELSFGEKQMLEKAEARLVSEIALAKARPHDKIVGELRELLS